MPLTTYGKNKQANAIAYDKASIHTGDPGDDGSANELNGGTPAYARMPITFAAADNGNRDSEVQPKFNIPGGKTITHYALWEGANCVATGTLSSPESYGAQGFYTLTDADISNN